MENTGSKANGRQASAASESSKAKAGKQAKASKNASDAKNCKTASDLATQNDRHPPVVLRFCLLYQRMTPCEGVTSSNSLWGYYTPTPPHYCFIPLSCIRFVKEQRLTRVLHPRAPCGGIIPPHPQAITLFLFHASVLSRNCAEKFRGQRPLKFSRP